MKKVETNDFRSLTEQPGMEEQGLQLLVVLLSLPVPEIENREKNPIIYKA